jgi:HSP20 family molecular chaperone IbpA
MSHHDSKEIQVKAKQEAQAPEQTKPGPVFIPPVDIFETDSDITVLADLPGVKTKDLSIDLRENTLTISGDIEPFENADEQDMLIEYEVGKYFRQFTLSNLIDRDKINAKLIDGVLTLTLPKAEAAKPRRIEIKS